MMRRPQLDRWSAGALRHFRWSGEVDEGRCRVSLQVVLLKLPKHDLRVLGYAVDELHLVLEAGLQLCVALGVSRDVAQILDGVETAILVIDQRVDDGIRACEVQAGLGLVADDWSQGSRTWRLRRPAWWRRQE